MNEYFAVTDIATAQKEKEKEMDLYHLMRKAAQADKQHIITLEQQLAAFQSAVEHVTEDGKTRRSFVAMPEGWAMVHKDRLAELEDAEEQLAAKEGVMGIQEAYDAMVRGKADVAKLEAEHDELREKLAAAETRLEGVKQQRDVERVSYLNEFDKNQVLIQQLSDSQKQVTLLRNQVLEECAAVAEDTAAGRDAEAIADAIRAMKRCISQ